MHSLLCGQHKKRNAQDQIEQTRTTMIDVLSVALVLVMGMTGLIAILLHCSVTRKVIRLTQVAAQLQAGKLDARALVDSEDELGQMAYTLNQMAESLGLTITQLEILHRASLALVDGFDIDKKMAGTVRRGRGGASGQGSRRSRQYQSTLNLSSTESRDGKNWR